MPGSAGFTPQPLTNRSKSKSQWKHCLPGFGFFECTNLYKSPVMKALTLAALLLIAGCFLPTPKRDKQNQPPQTQQAQVTPTPTDTVPTPVYKLSARDLAAVYEQNEVSADRDLKGTWIEVTGTVTQISKDIMDEPYILLDTEDQTNQVQCVISEGMAVQLKKGQQITVLGKCYGLTLMSVIIDDCKQYKTPMQN